MRMARKGLPKKYAKMGFKKGWAAYKRTKKKGTRKRRANPKKKTRRRRASKPQGRKRMGRRGFRLGNKKAVVGWTVAFIMADGVGKIKHVIDNPNTQGIKDVYDDLINNRKAAIAVAGGTYWLWGKPYNGRL